jgi:hypothetical protein
MVGYVKSKQNIHIIEQLRKEEPEVQERHGKHVVYFVDNRVAT